jgi:hypothetical protein
MGQSDRFSGHEEAGTAKLPPVKLFADAQPAARAPELKLDAHQAQLLAARPMADQTFQQIGREIAAGGFDKRAAQALDEGKIDATAKLFDDAFKIWGAPGVKELAESVSKLEKPGTGLDIKISDFNTETSYLELIGGFRVVQPRSAVGQFFADRMGWADNELNDTSLHNVIQHANSSWDQQVWGVRSAAIASDADFLENMFRSGNKSEVTARLLDMLGNTKPAKGNYVNNERTIGSYLKGTQSVKEHGIDVMSVLERRLSGTDIGKHLPQWRAGKCISKDEKTSGCSMWDVVFVAPNPDAPERQGIAGKSQKDASAPGSSPGSDVEAQGRQPQTRQPEPPPAQREVTWDDIRRQAITNILLFH